MLFLAAAVIRAAGALRVLAFDILTVVYLIR